MRCCGTGYAAWVIPTAGAERRSTLIVAGSRSISRDSAAIGGGILAVVVIALLAFVFLAGGDPEVGDCLEEDGQQLAVADCDDSAAAWKLIGIQDGEQSYDEYIDDPETCSEFPAAVQSFWIGENGDETGDETGDVSGD